jgi:uncharacterized protein involved in response to NO
MNEPKTLMNSRWVPFAYGFRPFFLLAGIYAAIGMSVWLWAYIAGWSPLPSLPPQLWHSHEMLFGFIAAAVAGFVLTAVPSWTGSRGFAGAPLVVLVMLWLAGRIAFAFFDEIPLDLVILAEVLFLPAVIVTIAPSLFRTRNRNIVLLLVIAAFWAADLVFLHAIRSGDIAAASAALRVGIDVILFLLTIIAGRIVPSFTANALRNQGMEVSLRSSKLIERGVFIAMLAYIAVDVSMFFQPSACWSSPYPLSPRRCTSCACLAGTASNPVTTRSSGYCTSPTCGCRLAWHSGRCS